MFGVPEFLVRDFVAYEFNQRKLHPSTRASAAFEFSLDQVHHLDSRWPDDNRTPPAYIRRYLRFEAQGACAFYRLQKPNYQYAHIRSWAQSRSHSPHNLLYLCLDCHQTHGSDVKLLRGIKEEVLRRIQLLDRNFVYDCASNMLPGEAVFALNGVAYRADARDPSKLATGFVQTKVGRDRCTMQRSGVIVAARELQPGEYYALSPAKPSTLR